MLQNMKRTVRVIKHHGFSMNQFRKRCFLLAVSAALDIQKGCTSNGLSFSFYEFCGKIRKKAKYVKCIKGIDAAISRKNRNFRFYSRERKYRSRRLRSGAFYDYHTILDFGGQTEKRVSCEIGLRFFIRRSTDKFCTDMCQ